MTVRKTQKLLCNKRIAWGIKYDDKNRKVSTFRPERRNYDFEITTFQVGGGIEYKAPDLLVSFLQTEFFITADRGLARTYLPRHEETEYIERVSIYWANGKDDGFRSKEIKLGVELNT